MNRMAFRGALSEALLLDAMALVPERVLGSFSPCFSPKLSRELARGEGKLGTFRIHGAKVMVVTELRPVSLETKTPRAFA